MTLLSGNIGATVKFMVEGTDLAVFVVQVESASGIIDGAMLPCLDAQTQLCFCQVAQRPGLALVALADGHHQGRVCGSVTRHLARVTKKESLHCNQYIGNSSSCLGTCTMCPYDSC